MTERSSIVPPYYSDTPTSEWWYTVALEETEELIANSGIVWADLQLTDDDIESGNSIEYVKKLNRAAGFLQWVSMELQKVDSELVAIEKTLEWVSVKRLAKEENSLADRPKGSQGMRLALFIDGAEPLKKAKLRSIELRVRKDALERVREALDVLWKTTSRAISARASEPLDR